MPAVALLSPWKAPVALPTRRRHPKATFATDAGHRFTVPFAPLEADLAGYGMTYAIIERPGRKALVLPNGPGLRTFALELLIARPDHQQPVEDLLHTLRDIAAGAHRVTIGNLGLDVALTAWRLTEATQHTLLRQYGTNYTSRATVPLTFTEASDAVVRVGPLSGGAVVAPRVAAPSSRPGRPATVRSYTVVTGDTLTGITVKVYGSTARAGELGKVNHITDPRKLRVGQRLTIPA